MGSIFRKGSEQSGQSQAISNQQAGLANALAESTGGLRADSIYHLGNFTRNGVMPSFLKSTVGLGVPIQQQEAELANAKRGIMDSLPRGGLQQRALMELPLQRLLQRDMFAANRNAIDDATRQNLFSAATNIGFGQGGAAMNGMGAAAGNLNSLGQQRMGQNYQAQQGIGKLIGSAAGAAMGMPGVGGMAGKGFGSPGAVSQPMPGIGSFNVGSNPFLVNLPH